MSVYHDHQVIDDEWERFFDLCSDENARANNEFTINYIARINPTERIILQLVGLPGSGKSTLARRLVESSRFGRRIWVSFSQDSLGSRGRVKSSVNIALKESNCSIIIDRCNFNQSQRLHWLNGLEIYDEERVHFLCLVMPRAVNIDYCVKKAISRGIDEDHNKETDWFKVCSIMAKDFTCPSIEEGFGCVYYCSIDETYSLERFYSSILLC